MSANILEAFLKECKVTKWQIKISLDDMAGDE